MAAPLDSEAVDAKRSATEQTPTPNDLAQLKPIFRFGRKFSDDAPLEALPAHWIREITRLRKENAKTRIELRESRAELAEAQQRIAALMLDVANLREGIHAIRAT